MIKESRKIKETSGELLRGGVVASSKGVCVQKACHFYDSIFVEELKIFY
jgi:hypothetical protein